MRTRSVTRRWHRRQGWVLAALVLLLTLVSHDITMASDPHRATPHHQAATTAADAHPLATHAGPVDTETACGVDRDGTLVSTPERPIDPLMRAAPASHIASRLVPCAGTRSDPLTHPAARRALLQVWLI